MKLAAALQTRWMLSGPLVVTAALFVIGVAAERSTGDAHHDTVAGAGCATATTAHSETNEHNPAGEAGEQGEAANHEVAASGDNNAGGLAARILGRR